MGDRTAFSAEVSADTRFSELVVERFQSDVSRAESHAIGRNRRVGQFLCILSLMRSHALLPKGTTCRVVGAGVQDFKSRAGREAAHLMPGQALLDIPGRGEVLPWTPVHDKGTRRDIGALFSRVQDLDGNFNKADSYAEKYAKPPLKRLLAQASNAVLAARALPEGRVNVPAVQEAYAQWIAQSRLSYRSAINRKIDIADLDDLPPATAPVTTADGRHEHAMLNERLPELLQRAVRKSKSGQKPGVTVWDYSEQTRILGHYLRASQDTILGTRLIQGVQDAFSP